MFFRPHLDSLEGRLLPAPLLSPLLSAVAGATAMAHPGPTSAAASPKPPVPAAPASQIDVTVSVNAPDKVIDLEPYIANWEGVGHGDIPNLSIIRNTNRNLVTGSLSGTDLTLAFARGQSGSATITVGVTDGNGASMQIAINITVQAATVAGPVRLPSMPAPLIASPGLSLLPPRP
jgi:hypothetical protein